jgi:hypothetical protein
VRGGVGQHELVRHEALPALGSHQHHVAKVARRQVLPKAAREEGRPHPHPRPARPNNEMNK